MKYLSFIFLLLFWKAAGGQNTFAGYFHSGKYNTGYCDTILYTETVTYRQYGYNGPAPLFVQIWHPVEKKQTGPLLRFGELRKRALPENLKRLYDSLYAKSDTAFIDYNIAYTVPEEEPIDYGQIPVSRVLDSLKSYKTTAFPAALEGKSGYPVIVYHHGSQSIAEENFAMAEFFASRGFIFISANFHLPYAGMPIGASPFLSSQAFENDQLQVKNLMRFAKQITDNKNIFFIGHSWGAQSGWGFLFEKGWASAFVSLETTLEDKNDTVKIKERWPEMYSLIKTQRKKYPLPVLLFSGSRLDHPFHFFYTPGENNLLFASARSAFEHNSFTAVYLMRYFFRSGFNQPDAAYLKEQLHLYAGHLEMIHSFLLSVTEKKPFDKSRYLENFYIH